MHQERGRGRGGAVDLAHGAKRGPLSRGQRRALALVLITLVAAVPIGCGATRPEAAGDGTATALPTEACTAAGSQRECHRLLGSTGGVNTCMTGTQLCAGGFWGECKARADGLLESAFTVSPFPAAPGDPRPLALSPPLADARACTNPCDPGCTGYDEDAGPAGLDASLRFDALVAFPGTNPGFESKLLSDDCTGGYTGPCENYDTANANTGAVASACQADTYCQYRAGGSGNGCCTRFNAGETHDTQVKGAVVCRDAKPDITTSGACKLNGRVVVPVCNRGKAAVPAGTTLNASIEAAAGTLPYKTGASCYVPSAPDCAITLAAPLAPGECVHLIESQHCSAGALNGNKVVYVNSGASPVSECALDVKDSMSTATDQLGCSNNFTAFNSSQLSTCPTLGEPKILTQQYSGACAPGSRAQWGRLGWKASTPGQYVPPTIDQRSQIVFEVRAADRLADGGVGPWSPYAFVGNTRIGGDPNDCRMDGTVAGCPKDLYVPLGGLPTAQLPVLEVRITMTGAGPFNPTLFGWYVAFTCVAAE